MSIPATVVNGYGYVLGNPLSLTDSSGREVDFFRGLVKLVASAGAAAFSVGVILVGLVAGLIDGKSSILLAGVSFLGSALSIGFSGIVEMVGAIAVAVDPSSRDGYENRRIHSERAADIHAYAGGRLLSDGYGRDTKTLAAAHVARNAYYSYRDLGGSANCAGDLQNAAYGSVLSDDWSSVGVWAQNCIGARWVSIPGVPVQIPVPDPR